MADKQAYLKRKKDRERLDQFREVCLKCFRPLPHCLCPHVHAFDTQTRFIILMHPKEAKRTRNGTGRLAFLSLKNSDLFIGVDFTQDPKLNALISNPDYLPLILFPGEQSILISDVPEKYPDLKGRSPLVIVLDGTWAAAKKMMKLSTNLHNIPRIKIQPAQPSRFKIKKQPHPIYLSTIEAIFAVLDKLDSSGIENLENKHSNLMHVFDRLVNTQLTYIRDFACSGIRRNPGKAKEADTHA